MGCRILQPGFKGMLWGGTRSWGVGERGSVFVSPEEGVLQNCIKLYHPLDKMGGGGKSDLFFFSPLLPSSP